MLTVIVVGSIVSTALLWNEQRKTASALALAQDEQRKAEQKAEEAKAITDFLVKDLLGSVDPKKAKGRKVTVDEVLANAEAKIDTAFKDKPLTEAAIRNTLARVIVHLRPLHGCQVSCRAGQRTSHRPSWCRARRHSRGHKRPRHRARQQGELEEARKLNEQVLEAQQRILGPDHPNTLTTMNRLGSNLQDQGELEKARKLLEQVLEARRRILGPDNEATLPSMTNLAIVLWKQRKVRGGPQALRRVPGGTPARPRARSSRTHARR